MRPDPDLNPYTPGAGLAPRALAGRDHELEAFERLLRRLERGNAERSMVLCGLRGVGKTVLLREMGRRAVAREWLVSGFEAREGSDLRAEFSDAVLAHVSAFDRGERARAAFRRLLEHLPVFRGTVTASGDLSLELGPRQPLLQRSLAADLRTLLGRVGEAAREADRGVLLLVDELQQFDRAGMEALCAAMHHVGQEALPVALVAAGLPSLPGDLAAAMSYAERLFAYPRIDRLDDAALRDAIVEAARQVDPDVRFEPSALSRMVKFSGGYPLMIQAIGKHTWDQATSRNIGEADVRRAERAAFLELSDELFLSRWQRATPRQRDYLAALAAYGDRCRSAQAARKAGFPTARAASVVRDELIAKGLIWAPERGQIAFTVPHFERFVHTTGHELPELGRDDLGPGR